MGPRQAHQCRAANERKRGKHQASRLEPEHIKGTGKGGSSSLYTTEDGVAQAIPNLAGKNVEHAP